MGNVLRRLLSPYIYAVIIIIWKHQTPCVTCSRRSINVIWKGCSERGPINLLQGKVRGSFKSAHPRPWKIRESQLSKYALDKVWVVARVGMIYNLGKWWRPKVPELSLVLWLSNDLWVGSTKRTGLAIRNFLAKMSDKVCSWQGNWEGDLVDRTASVSKLILVHWRTNRLLGLTLSFPSDQLWVSKACSTLSSPHIPYSFSLL